MEPRIDILVVDDNPTDLLFFSRAANKTLPKIRLQILTAGQEAIDYLNAKGEYSDRSKYPVAGCDRSGLENAKGERVRFPGLAQAFRFILSHACSHSQWFQ